MARKFTHALRIALLVLYAAYSLSPIYVSVAAACADARHEHVGQEHSPAVGIVWVNVLLSSLVDEQVDDELSAAEQAVAEPDPELILIRKTRAVLREQPAAAPPLSAMNTLPETTADPVHLALPVSEIPLDLKHRQADGHATLHAGLSPPLRLS